MAKIKDAKSKREIEINDGELIKETCRGLGVPFSCEDGLCGTCMIDIKKGRENLSEFTQQEKDMGMDKARRLACQCRIKKGNVEIEF